MSVTIVRLGLILSIVAILGYRSAACTIFILTDAYYTLFYNNEDFVNPNIGSRNGELYFDRSKESRALGFGTGTFKRMYNREAAVHPAFGSEILKACVATGEGGTKYSNVYNLRTGDITIYNFSPGAESTTFNLFTELEKGAHYYEIAKIEKQITAPVQSLLLNMHRLILFEFSPLSDQAPAITSRVRKFMEDARNRKMEAADYSENLWKELSASQGELKAELEQTGDVESIQLIRKRQNNEMTIYSYVVIFKKARALMQFTFDDKMKMHNIGTLSGDTNE